MDTASGRASHLLESWLELREALEQHPGLKRLLFDPVTGLPTTPLLFPRIEALLRDRGEVNLLALDVVRYSKIEEIYGWKVFDDVMRHVAESLESAAGAHLRDADIVAEVMISGNSFVIVLSPPRNKLLADPEELRALARRVEDGIRADLATRLEASLFQKFGCYVGCATVNADERVRMERLVHDGLRRALADSREQESVEHEARIRRLRAIIDAEDIRTHVHPVMRLTDMAVVGYEALSRGPEGGEFERPDKLFRVAYDADLVMRLERLCRKKALQAAVEMPKGRLLFLNIEPEAVADPELRDAVFSTLLADSELTPDHVVLEITERTAVVDFCGFRSTLEYLRAIGFQVAVDDAGAGFGSLQCLAEVKPEWVKVDISLVRGCDTDEVRRNLVACLVQFTKSVGVNLIAEGIETEAELATLKTIGVEYGQGFLFSLPVPPFPEDPPLLK